MSITVNYAWHTIIDNFDDKLSYEEKIYLHGFVDCLNDVTEVTNPLILKLIGFLEKEEENGEKI